MPAGSAAAERMSGVEEGAALGRRRIRRVGARSKMALLTASEPVHDVACLGRRGGRDRLLHRGRGRGPEATNELGPKRFRSKEDDRDSGIGG